MEVKNVITIEFTKEYLKARNNLSLVIKYLDELKSKQPSIDVNNDCIRLIMEAMQIQSKLYLELNNLPVINAEFELQNHVLKIQVKKLEQEIKMLAK
jgi:hypothetical protein